MTPADAVAGYAARFHSAIGPEHHVGSALGGWLLLSLLGTDAAPRSHERLNEVLGMDGREAKGFAAALLGSPHPSVRLGMGAWADSSSGELTGWMRALPAQVERGRLPTQRAADAWTRRASQGMVRRFPGSVSRRETLLLLASVVALSVRWRDPFLVVPAGELGDHQWSDRLRTVLSDESAEARIVRTAIGEIAVHSAFADDGSLRVDSVIAHRDVPASEVLGIAHRVATVGDAVEDVSLFNLPLGTHPLWTITEELVSTPGGVRKERYRALLPAWSATTETSLNGAEFGFDIAREVLTTALGPPRETVLDTRQGAFAEYSRTGFKAAAATGTVVAYGIDPYPKPGVVRTATLHFRHPYAIVAVAHRGRVGRAQNLWSGLPVVGGWIVDPD